MIQNEYLEAETAHRPQQAPEADPEPEHWPRLEDSLKSLLFGPEVLASGPPPVRPFQSPSTAKDRKPKLPNVQRKASVESGETSEVDSSDILTMTKEQHRDALLKECAKEEFALLQVGSENFNEKLTHYRRPEFVSQYLRRNDIRPLKKRSEKFPKALYYCRLCDYHCDRLSICITHIEDTRHSRLAKMQEVEITLFHLPKPTKHHLDTLEQLLINVEKDVALSPADLQARSSIADKLDAIFKQFLAGSSVRLYGSSLSGFGIIDSDVNLDLQIPDSIKPDRALIRAFEIINSCPDFENVQHDFSSKIPTISFNVSHLKCELSLNNHHAFQTSTLLRDYFQLDSRVKTLSASLRLWSKMCRIDKQAEGTLPAHAFALMLVYFLQQGKRPILPCIHDQLSSRDPDVYESPIEYLSSVKIRNNCTAAELWIEFFEFYSLGFNVNDDVVSVRNVGGFSRDEKRWKGKKLAIEDPFSTKRSLTRSVNNPHNLDFITDCFKIGYLYFGTVQTTQGPTVIKIIVPDSPAPGKAHQQPKEETDRKTDDVVNQLLSKLQIDESEIGAKPPNILPARVLTVEELERTFNVENCEQVSEDDSMTFETFRLRHGTELTPKQAQRVAEIVPKNMILFKFDADIFTAGQRPIFVCTVCGREGHLQSSCPDENLPALPPFPPMTSHHKSVLNRVCTEIMFELQPSKDEIREREFILRDLSRDQFIARTFPTARLTLYGSSCNGFAIAHSDLDISLTFTDYPTDETINSIEIIEKLAEKLQRMQGIRNIQPITSAKVPILKFIHFDSRIEGDISLYNILAQENTRMLATYALIDIRTKILGYVVKFFAKVCDIGDASRGSLSSYAYILMLIFYLQQCNPPVLPVLQELYEGDTKPVKTVDRWNAWFYSDMEKLKEVWPGLGRNQQSVAELWIGFLEFYGSSFNDKTLVVSIRQSKPLTKFEKMWNSPCVAIEDPFDLDHNLGAGLSRRMNLFIKRAFWKSRDHFGTQMPMYMSIIEIKHHFFEPELMCDGLPPNDRGCRACGKIGHLVRDCPRKKSTDERRKRDRRDKTDSGRNHRNSEAREFPETNTLNDKNIRRNKQQQTIPPGNGNHPLQQQQHHQPHQQQHQTKPEVAKNSFPAERSSSTEQPDPHFMSLLANIGRLEAPQPGGIQPEHPVTAQRFDLPPMSRALTVEELERSFRQRGKTNHEEVDPRSVGPPPGFIPGTKIPAPTVAGFPDNRRTNAGSNPNFAANRGVADKPNPLINFNSFANMHQTFPVHPAGPGQHATNPPLPNSHPGLNHVLAANPMPRYSPNPVGNSNPVGFRPFEPSPFPMVSAPSAFNPFHSFGPIVPGPSQSLLLQGMAKSGSPVGEPSSVQMNNSLGLNSAFGLQNFFIPPQPHLPVQPPLPPPPVVGGLGFGPDTWSVTRPLSGTDFLNLGNLNPGNGNSAISDPYSNEKSGNICRGWP